MPSLRLRESRSGFAREAALLALALAVTAAAPAGANERAKVGRPAPAFILQRPAGGDLTLATFARRPVLLNVYASWCAACRSEAAGLIAAYRRSREGRVFGYRRARECRARRIVRPNAPRAIPDRLDGGQFAATYGSSQIPQTVFIDSHGVVRSIGVGAMTPQQIDAGLSKILSSGGDT